MPLYPTRNSITLITIACIINCTSCLFAQEISQDLKYNRGYLESAQTLETKKGTAIFKEENLTVFQKQARLYRSQGLELQRTGNLDGALSLYQKAIELDPAYAVVYNDLGVIYEAEGLIERAEESYLKAVNLDSDYLSPYSNLALLYENKRDLQKAAHYWRQRANLGLPGDPWTQRAKQRLEDILLVMSDRPLISREQQVLDFMQDVAKQKKVVIKQKKVVIKPETKLKGNNIKPETKLRDDNKELAKKNFEKAKSSYAKKDYVTALKKAIDAQLLDPSNKSINEFIEQVQARLLAR